MRKSDILLSRVDETIDLLERCRSALLNGLAEQEPYEIARAIAAAGELRTAILDVMQTHMHSEHHPYGQAMREHVASCSHPDRSPCTIFSDGLLRVATSRSSSDLR